jgi:hypothetical protein
LPLPRTLFRNRFTLIVEAHTALVIGVNTAIFSVLRGTSSPLPYKEPDRAVMLWSHRKGWDQTRLRAGDRGLPQQSQVFRYGSIR